ncbi:MAG: hypothetical protein EOO43_23885 [Flavobacterium sp.]|nr:MAG: hypothetical protein EOO43_23885 [Flavobacterium sp.]
MLVLLTICINLLALSVTAQKHSNNDNYRIHSAVLKSLDENKYNVFKETRKRSLEQFDFTLNSSLSDRKDDISKQIDWRRFVAEIDTAELENYNLSSGNRLWFRQHKRNRKNIVFAPVMMSISQKKALCVFHMFNRSTPGSYMAAYLVLSDKRWIVKKIETFVYFD